MTEQCESCSGWFDDETMMHDIEGVPLCPECMASEPKYTADDYDDPPMQEKQA